MKVLLREGITVSKQGPADRATIGDVVFALERDAKVKRFVEDQFSGELRHWLLNGAPNDLRTIAGIRNKAAHSGPVSEQEAQKILEMVLGTERQPSVLRYFLDAGRLTLE
ncbi:MAG: hypothetical protein A2Z18_03245 [Armatimonadetes bacterium RBG_16_58_9]|nr:MAG: hypothetical protein A2Z18_03245 [Armatimonadetes bacterium RBG_16_58_9]